ncbi:hypothetical protein TH63_18555 [Rufibacter radiotolerans]|uniref:Uncharacterized protein n=1 Tax=Rufibacter radiotolerans TaxID=1379910 RepID=A0A0H4VTD2_9BACT|nr:hypothetical protein [Rufibacter radiotolerans]AKQ47187.1 hypothetical protein TH63_18555 [Rufibacter radiotolerans]
MERHSHHSVAGFPPRRQRKSISSSGPVLGGLVALFLIGLFLMYRSNVFQTQQAPAATTVAPSETLQVQYPPKIFPSTADLGAHPMFAPLAESASDTLPKIFVKPQR